MDVRVGEPCDSACETALGTSVGLIRDGQAWGPAPELSYGLDQGWGARGHTLRAAKDGCGVDSGAAGDS